MWHNHSMRCLMLGLSLLLVGFAHASESRIEILARVAGHAISDRELVIEASLANPALYTTAGRRPKLAKPEEQKVLNRLIVEYMILEENRIVGSEKVSRNTVENKVQQTRRAFGNRWNSFLSDFGMSEVEVQERVSRALLVNQSIKSRAGEDGSDPEKSLADWIKSLRSRYRIYFLNSPTAAKPSSSTQPAKSVSSDAS